jgi:hypothetical protein
MRKGLSFKSNLSTVTINPFVFKSIGIDPGFGSSSFGIVVTQFIDSNQVQVLHAEEYQKSDFNQMLDIVWDLITNNKFSFSYSNSNDKIYVDGGANPSFIRSLKTLIGDRSDYETVIEQAKKITRWNWQNLMMIVAVHFSTEHRDLLNQTKLLLQYGYLSINPIDTKIITALRTAVANEYSLDKEATSYDDCLDDALRLSLKPYEFA